MFVFLLSGCAIDYSNYRTGSERLLGFGRLRMETNSTGTMTKIVTERTVPGLCLAFGPDHFGFSFGYNQSQQLVVVGTNETSKLQPPQMLPGLDLSNAKYRVAGFGYMTMKSVPQSHGHRIAVITGRALAGAGASISEDDAGLYLGVVSRRMVVSEVSDSFATIEEEAPRWPGFDLFSATLKNSSSTEQLDSKNNDQ